MAITLSSLVNPTQQTRGTFVALSGTSAGGFTAIPSTVKQIQLVVQNVSTSGGDDVYVQIGSGSYQVTGYTSHTISTAVTNLVAGASSTVAFNIPSNNASNVWSGVFNLVNITGNIWVCSATASGTGATAQFAWAVDGSVSLSGVLDRIRITVSGSNTFDNGTINVIYQ